MEGSEPVAAGSASSERKLLEILAELKLVASHDGNTLEGLLDGFLRDMKAGIADDLRSEIAECLR